MSTSGVADNFSLVHDQRSPPRSSTACAPSVEPVQFFSRLAKGSIRRLSRVFQSPFELVPTATSSPRRATPSASPSSSTSSSTRRRRRSSAEDKKNQIKSTISYPILKSTTCVSVYECPDLSAPSGSGAGWDEWGVRDVKGFTLTLGETEKFEDRQSLKHKSSTRRSSETLVEQDREHVVPVEPFDLPCDAGGEDASSVRGVDSDVEQEWIESYERELLEAASPKSDFSLSLSTLDNFGSADLAARSSYTTSADTLNDSRTSHPRVLSDKISLPYMNPLQTDTEVAPTLSYPSTPTNQAVFPPLTPPNPRPSSLASSVTSALSSVSSFSIEPGFVFARTTTMSEALASPFPFDVNPISRAPRSPLVSPSINTPFNFEPSPPLSPMIDRHPTSRLGESLREWQLASTSSSSSSKSIPRIPEPTYCSEEEDEDVTRASFDWSTSPHQRTGFSSAPACSIEDPGEGGVIWPDPEALAKIGWTSLEKRTRSSV